MNEQTDELIKCYFKQKDLLEFKNNQRERVDNAYLDFFERRNTAHRKPEFNTGILVAVELLIISLLFYAKFLWWILINIVVIILLIISCNKSQKKWKIVNDEYNNRLKNNDAELIKITEKIATILKEQKNLMPYGRILQNKILNGEILTFEDAELFLLNNQKIHTDIIQNYWTCDYCGSYNEHKSLRCVCCGSNKKV